MMKLTVTLTENGKPREAIPVRAVPLATDWFVSADLLAIALAGGDCSFRPGLKAYKIEEEEIKIIPPADWRLITDQLQAIDASLPAGVPGKYEWRERSISELPSTAFLWADEFSDAYRKSFNNAIHLELSEGETLHANGEVRIPMIVPDKFQRIALQGFQEMPRAIAAQKNSPIQLEQPSTAYTSNTRTRTSQLTSEINKAKLTAINPGDHQSVWSALSQLALDEEGAFTGNTDPKQGLEYKAHNGKGEQTKRWFSIGALRKRMNPNAR